MRCILFKETKRISSTFVPTGSGLLDTDIVLKAPCTLESPSITFTMSDATMSHNYMKLQWDNLTDGAGSTHDWKYYFLKDRVILDDNRILCTYTEDVMGSKWDQIRTTNQRIGRTNNDSYYNDSLLDPMITTSDKVDISAQNAFASHPYDLSNGCYLIGIKRPCDAQASTTYPLLQVGAIQYFLTDSDGASDFMNALQFSSGLYADINFGQYVTSCRYIPYSVATLHAWQSRIATTRNSFAYFNFRMDGIKLYQYEVYMYSQNGGTGAFLGDELVQLGDSLKNGGSYDYGEEEFALINSYIMTRWGYSPYSDENVRSFKINSKTKITDSEQIVQLKCYRVSIGPLTNPIFETTISSSMGPLPVNPATLNETSDKRYHILNNSPYSMHYLYAGPYGVIPLEWKYASTNGYFKVKETVDLTTGVSTLFICDTSDDKKIIHQKSAMTCPQVALSTITSNSFITQSTLDNQYALGNWSVASQITSGFASTALSVLGVMTGIGNMGSAIHAPRTYDLFGKNPNKLVMSDTERSLFNSGIYQTISSGSTGASGLGGIVSGIGSLVINHNQHDIDSLSASIPKSTYTTPQDSFTSISLPWVIVSHLYEVRRPEFSIWGRVAEANVNLSNLSQGDCFCLSYVNLDGISGTTDEKTALQHILTNMCYIE